MKKTTSLLFTKDGLINADSLDHLVEKSIDTLVLFSDGSSVAYDHMLAFDTSQFRGTVPYIGLGRLPLYEVRVTDTQGIVSKPHYMSSDDVKMKWICTKVIAPYMKIYISDISSQSNTYADMDVKQIELISWLAYKLWVSMLEAESRLCFPATVIDRLVQWTYALTPKTMDIELLRDESGLHSLDYNHNTNLLSIDVAGDTFSVNLTVLNTFYGDFILPLFNASFGRRLRMKVSVTNSEGQYSEAITMSYGELGRLVEDMRSCVKERVINTSSLIDPDDLFSFAKKVKINEQTCFWPADHQSIQQLLHEAKDHFVRSNNRFDAQDAADAEYSTQELIE